MKRRLGGAPAEAGQTLVFVVLMMPILLGMVGLAVDVGMWYVQRQQAQSAADFGALSAAARLPGSPSAAHADAQAQVNKNVANAVTTVTAPFEGTPGRAEVRVVVKGNTYFSKIVGLDTVDIGARAVAETATVTALPGSLPIGILKDQYKITHPPTNTPLGDGSDNKNGLIYPEAGPTCAPITGGSAIDAVITSGRFGGIDACAMAPGTSIDTKKGWTAGNIKKGFDDRLGSNTQSFSDVFEWDAASGRYSVKDPSSPRIGIIPIMETLDGTSDWGDKTMRIVGYVLCYLGDTSKAPGYPAHEGGKTVYVSPVSVLLPEDWQGSTGPSTGVTGAPVIYRLID